MNARKIKPAPTPPPPDPVTVLGGESLPAPDEVTPPPAPVVDESQNVAVSKRKRGG